MAQTFNELAFSPTIQEVLESRPSQRITVLTGANNSGKSAYLKKTVSDRSMLYVGVNRFYSFHHLPLYTKNERELDEFYSNHNSNYRQQFHNFEGSYFNCSTAITRLSNERRGILFETFYDLFGIKVEVSAEDPQNDFSNRFVSVGGESLSVTSSGTRLFLGILAALMDERFSAVAVDEPELGLSPTLQKRLANIVIRGEKQEKLFPHKPKVILSTHSHLFLDRENPENNYVVSKAGNLISAKQCTTIVQLHDIQFRLLGNDLSELYLPDVVIFVEGETDKIYIEKVLGIHIPNSRIVVEACGGNIASRLSFWASSLGDIQLSPYRNRTIIVYDAVKQAGIESLCKRVGLPVQNMIEWQGNGIEYVYPDGVIAAIYRKSGLIASNLVIDKDSVTYGDISYKKMELCKMVCEALTIATILPDEFTEKLLGPLQALMHRVE